MCSQLYNKRTIFIYETPFIFSIIIGITAYNIKLCFTNSICSPVRVDAEHVATRDGCK